MGLDLGQAGGGDWEMQEVQVEMLGALEGHERGERFVLIPWPQKMKGLSQAASWMTPSFSAQLGRHVGCFLCQGS